MLEIVLLCVSISSLCLSILSVVYIILLANKEVSPIHSRCRHRKACDAIAPLYIQERQKEMDRKQNERIAANLKSVLDKIG